MTQSHIDVLLVEDSGALAKAYMEYLKSMPITVTHVATGAGAQDVLKQQIPKVMLLDLALPDINGMDILRQVSKSQMPIEVIIITAHGSVDVVVDAMHSGARDFLEKPFSADRLVTTVRNALERHRLSGIVESLDDVHRNRYCGFVGSSMPMQAVYKMIDNVAPSNASVFITGESGTGKEVCAEAVHKMSGRRDGPLIALNCAAIPQELIESEIFGHIKGAFTGAATERKGAASQADGGTLFLDEIAEMDIDLQAKLLRFIQTSSFQKVGSNKLETVDVRFVCATNKDPLVAVREGRFREDLYYRLHVIPIELPPLRDRDDDVLEIANLFLADYSAQERKEFNGFSTEAADILRTYHWPGNVRELQNVVRNIVVMNNDKVVTETMLPPPLNEVKSSRLAGTAFKQSRHNGEPYDNTDAQKMVTDGEIGPLWLVEKQVIEKAIDLYAGNIPKAAALLEVSPSTIYRKRQAWSEEKTQ
ncbi:MAG: sigma-54 dependent transcriptional regulator [Gammaproteobacteria bacterium]|nr:sigma-54 dependent transcriptional regulator [Gammaproteobacteria bacterium]MDH3467431.1 sigma-54 dependent transcriptional regulator [Gammaproteobacteria bacterium]